jgi:hypothetical protein
VNDSFGETRSLPFCKSSGTLMEQLQKSTNMHGVKNCDLPILHGIALRDTESSFCSYLVVKEEACVANCHKDYFIPGMMFAAR